MRDICKIFVRIFDKDRIFDKIKNVVIQLMGDR